MKKAYFFYLSSLTVILFNIFFIGLILKNGHKEYILRQESLHMNIGMSW